MKHGHLFGTRGAQVFEHQGLLLRVQMRRFGGHDFVDVALRFQCRINTVYL